MGVIMIFDHQRTEYKNGYKAAFNLYSTKKTHCKNPYNITTESNSYSLWERGWYDAQLDLEYKQWEIKNANSISKK